MSYNSWSVIFGEIPSASKWNILGTNDASFNDGSGIADSAILPKHLLTGMGSSWAWQSWTPTLTNLSGGTLTYAKYIQIGKTVFFRFKYILAGAGVSGGVLVTSPVTPHSDYLALVDGPIISTAYGIDVGAQIYDLFVDFDTSGRFSLRPMNASGTYLTSGAFLSSTVPFTWGNLDEIYIAGIYEAA